MVNTETQPSIAQDFLALQRSLFVEVPLTLARGFFGRGTQRENVDVGWKAYDSWIRLATTSVNDLYRSAWFGQTMITAFEGLVQLQRLSNVVTGSVFPTVWRIAGLATASDIQTVREEIQAALVVGRELPSATTALRQASLLYVTTQGREARQELFRTLRHARSHAGVPPHMTSPVSASPPLSPMSAIPTGDLLDYFEPLVNTGQDEALRSTTPVNFSEYFEPVTDLPLAIHAHLVTQGLTKPMPIPPQLPSLVFSSAAEQWSDFGTQRKKKGRTLPR